MYHIRIIANEKLVLVVGNIFRLETCMNSLVKVPPYSILNFQGKIVFIQNWCNITLNVDCFRKEKYNTFLYLDDAYTFVYTYIAIVIS